VKNGPKALLPQFLCDFALLVQFAHRAKVNKAEQVLLFEVSIVQSHKKFPKRTFYRENIARGYYIIVNQPRAFELSSLKGLSSATCKLTRA
jgi:hypothetical protein